MSTKHKPSKQGGTGVGAGAKIALFVALVVACIGVGIGYVLHARSNTPSAGRASEPTVTATQASLAAVMAGPYLVARNTDLGPAYGKVVLLPLADLTGPRAVTPLECDRVAMAHGVGLCLTADRGVVTTYRGEIFDANFHILHEFPLPGLPSRARVSPDGRFAAMTLFVYGDSYASTNFSTRTMFVDTQSGKLLGNLEQFQVTDNGRAVNDISRNYWGVTFAADSNRFYATLAVGTSIHLIEGDLARREAHTIANGVECPSLSPDGTRVAYKLRTGGALTGVRWRLHVLDLATGVDHALAETRSVDDQVEWLDDQRVLYALPRASSGTAVHDTWVVLADGTGSPQIFVRGTESPTVTRTP